MFGLHQPQNRSPSLYLMAASLAAYMFGLHQPQNRSPSLYLMAASLGAGPSLSSLHISSSSLCFSKSSPSLKLQFSFSAPTLSLNSPFSPLPPVSCHKLNFKLYSAVQEIAVEEETQEQEGSSDEKKKKLFVVNLPWGFSVADMKALFGECGTVKHVEIIKAKDGRHKGFAFITMDSADEAQAVVEKFDSHELSGRIIRVEFAKSLKKPTAPPAAGTPAVETGHKLYVSNLAWKARATDLREFFSAEFNPVSARVVFDRPQGGSAGYGFVSFASKDEAEAVISSMDGKELMGRAVRLKFSEKNAAGSGNELQEESTPEGQSKEAEASVSANEESE